MRTRNFLLVGVLVLLGVPMSASASGVIIDMRSPEHPMALFSEKANFQLLALHAREEGGPGTGQGSHSLVPGAGGGSSDGAPPSFRPPRPLPLDPLAIEQIQAGLITEEEAMAGCGGASATAGPAGLLPMLVAAGALVRRRRR